VVSQFEKNYRKGGGATGARVRAERKLAILDKVCLYLVTMVADQAVSHRPFTVEAQVWLRPVHIGFVVDKVTLGQVFL
jgi:hypothetical protein